jgi:hypothetical protein
MALNIKTSYVFPPIPTRAFDWSAVTDDYEPGCPIGVGPTEQAAIDDLLEQIAMAEDDAERERFDNSQFGVGA